MTPNPEMPEMPEMPDEIWAAQGKDGTTYWVRHRHEALDKGDAIKQTRFVRATRPAAVDVLSQCTGIPASYGFCEPVEGYAERPQDLIAVLHEMGKAASGHLTPAPTGERAEALRLLNAAIENSWDGWFGDEDPNGDRENVRFIPYEDWDKLRDHFDIIRRALSQPVHCTGDAVEEWKNTIASFLGAFATCQKENQPDWMEYIAEEANKVCEAIGIHQRIVVNRRGNLGIEQMENDNA